MIRIMVDSACDLLPDQAQERGIEVLPLVANVGGREYRDGIDLGRDEFYELLERTGEFPHTSQVSPHTFAEAFKAARAAGDEVVAITLASELSGTHQSALLGRAMAGNDGIFVIDSCTATYLIAILAEYACALRDAGLGGADIARAVEELKPRVKLAAALDTLEYLQRGGRLPKAAAKVGEAAKLKPIITVSDEGSVKLLGAALGRKKALDGVARQLAKEDIDPAFPVFSLYSYGTKNVEKLEARLGADGVECVDRRQIGFVIGAHIGPGACGVAYVKQ